MQIPFHEISLEDWRRTLAVPLDGTFLCARTAAPKMMERKWGRVINISSIGVKYGGNLQSSFYTMSKAALESMTISLAKEGAAHNVLVNAIRLGVTETSFHDKRPNKNMEARIKMIPLQRMAQPKEVADFIFYLSSEESNFMTGTVIPFAGGE